MSARTEVITALKDIVDNTPGLELLKGRVVPAARGIGDLDRPAIVVKTGQYAPTPEAPTRNVTWTCVAALVSAHRDQEEAENDLETLLDLLSPHLLTHAMKWTSAELTNFDQQHLSLDIALEAIFQKE